MLMFSLIQRNSLCVHQLYAMHTYLPPTIFVFIIALYVSSYFYLLKKSRSTFKPVYLLSLKIMHSIISCDHAIWAIWSHNGILALCLFMFIFYFIYNLFPVFSPFTAGMSKGPTAETAKYIVLHIHKMSFETHLTNKLFNAVSPKPTIQRSVGLLCAQHTMVSHQQDRPTQCFHWSYLVTRK